MAKKNISKIFNDSVSLLISKNLNKLPKEIQKDLSDISFKSTMSVSNKCKAFVMQQSFTTNKFYIFVVGEQNAFINLFKSEFEKRVFEKSQEAKEMGWHLEMEEKTLRSDAEIQRKSEEIYKKALNVTLKTAFNSGAEIGSLEI